MNVKRIAYIIGWILNVEAAFMLIPLVCSIIYKEWRTAAAFACSIAISAAIGIILTHKKPANPSFYAKEGFIATTLSWIAMSVMGALPFYISGCIPSAIDAVFESVSGFTTTGASVFVNLDDVPRGILMWRCFSNFIGGMGVLVFMLAIIPLTRDGQSLSLIRAETTGISVNKFVPKLKEMASTLYVIYILMTALMIIMLLFGRMSFYEAVCLSFATAGTGGFGILNDSVASYGPYVQVVITMFMLLFGLNFMVYFLIFTKKIRNIAKMEEIRWYFAIFLITGILITVNLVWNGMKSGSLVDAMFQSAAMITTTAFSTTDFDLWPQFSKMLLLILMFTGACAGSTGGGIKVSRVLIYLKTVKKEVSYLLHPKRIKAVMMDGKKVDESLIRSSYNFLSAYLLILLISTALLALEDFSFATTFMAAVASINNTGIGLELIGPNGNYSIFSNMSKVVLMFNMLAGRLEIFPMLLLIIPKGK